MIINFDVNNIIYRPRGTCIHHTLRNTNLLIDIYFVLLSKLNSLPIISSFDTNFGNIHFRCDRHPEFIEKPFASSNSTLIKSKNYYVQLPKAIQRDKIKFLEGYP